MRCFRVLLLGCLLIACGVCRVSALEDEWFSFRLEQAAVYREDTVQLVVRMEENSLPEAIAGFRVAVRYDGDRFTMKKVEECAQMQSNTLWEYIRMDETVGVYVCDGAFAPNLQGDCVTFELLVNQEAEPGEAVLSVELDQIVDWSGNQYDNVCREDLSLVINEPLSSLAELEALKPSSGRLEPDFSPDVFEYRISVPASISTVELAAEAAENGTARVSRKNLLAAGSTTDITVTVTSEDREKKAEYLVRVDREEKKTASEEEVEQEDSEAERLEPSSMAVSEVHPENSEDAEVRLEPDESGEVEDSVESASSQTSSDEAQTSNPSSERTRSSAESSGSSLGEDPEEKEDEEQHLSSSYSDPPAYTPAQQGDGGQPSQGTTVIYGDRNLYIGSGDIAFLLWLLIGCVCVLIVVTIIKGSPPKNNKSPQKSQRKNKK